MKVFTKFLSASNTLAGPRIVSIRLAAVSMFALGHVGLLYAHDFWIEPVNFRPVTGDEVPLVLRVGQNLSGDRLPYINDWFSDYRVVAPSGARPIDGLMGDDPAGSFQALESGVHLVGYRSTRDFVELEPAKFDSYLVKEGLEHIIDLRAERGESDRPASEYYSRCAKSLIEVGRGGPDKAYAARLGYTLELVPQENPYALRPGDTLPLLLLYENEPIEGILIIAFTSDAPDHRVRARTDADGRAELPLDRPGLWLVKAVHMIAVPEAVTGADWESFWASLTFTLDGVAR